MSEQSDTETRLLAERVRQRCIEVAQDAYEQAGISGLCASGSWECAVGAMGEFDVQALVDQPAD